MAELDRAAISRRLRIARDEVGLSRVEMAELLVLHWRTIENYESPKHRVVPFDRLEEWARITGRTKEWLLHGDEPMVSADDRLSAIEETLERVVVQLQALQDLIERQG
jgi:transcriptional regulator with XRE-family HTH domain